MFKQYIFLIIIIFAINSEVKTQVLTDSLKVPIATFDIKYEILDLNPKPKKVNFNTEHYKYKAFFCRMEDLMYNKTGKNLRFRLGNLDYVNILESK